MSSNFGAEFEQVWPKIGASLNITDFCKNLLKKYTSIPLPADSSIDIQEFTAKSAEFPLKFPINTCRVISQPVERHAFIKKQINSAYPVIHERVLGLYLSFLEHKSRFGNKQELELFPKLSLTDFVQRLLEKRCASFFLPNDVYLLVSGENGAGGFENVGTENQKPPLTLSNVLSYDEIKLSAFLSVSSHSEFLNDGNRGNAGKIETDKSKIETEGVVVGIIGSRFERPYVMEYQDISITREQNTKNNGYGEKCDENCNRNQDYRQLWNRFYESPDFLYEPIKQFNTSRFSKTGGGNYFDNVIMKRRYAISFDTLLLEAQSRAAACDKQAYIHVVGIGLGVWKAVDHQVKIFLETFSERLKLLLKTLKNVSVVHFSWFNLTEWGDLKNGGMFINEQHKTGGIKILISNRNPAKKLPVEYEDMLVVVSYAWDGNALPGNEFWMNDLTSTGDTSTACSTLVSELHNPHINTKMVNGNNLHIATFDQGVISLDDYCEKIFKADNC